MQYFTADIHFSDPDTLLYTMRPFKNIKQYDRYMIKQINKTAKKDDLIYVCGDFFDCDGSELKSYLQASQYVKKIKAKMFLIIGNNEERIIKYFFDNDYEKFREYCLDLGFVDVQKSAHVNFGGREFYLIHEPIQNDPNYVNLFGHIHTGGIYRSYGINVGVDPNHYRLWSESDILDYLDWKEKYMNYDVNINLM